MHVPSIILRTFLYSFYHITSIIFSPAGEKNTTKISPPLQTATLMNLAPSRHQQPHESTHRFKECYDWKGDASSARGANTEVDAPSPSELLTRKMRVTEQKTKKTIIFISGTPFDTYLIVSRMIDDRCVLYTYGTTQYY